MDRFWNWFNAERLDRVEAETSQDMFQTNGSIIQYWGIMIPLLIAVFASIIYDDFGAESPRSLVVG